MDDQCSPSENTAQEKGFISEASSMDLGNGRGGQTCINDFTYVNGVLPKPLTLLIPAVEPVLMATPMPMVGMAMVSSVVDLG